MIEDRIQQMHSYALARIMKHVIGYEKFDSADHVIHGMLIDHKTGNLPLDNINEMIKNRIVSHKKMWKDVSNISD